MEPFCQINLVMLVCVQTVLQHEYKKVKKCSKEISLKAIPFFGIFRKAINQMNQLRGNVAEYI